MSRAVSKEQIDWYAANGQTKERFGATIDRVGLDALVAYVKNPA